MTEDTVRYCLVFRDGSFCDHGGGKHGSCKGCYGKMNAEHRSTFSVFWERHKGFVPRHYDSGHPERPSPYYDADAGQEKLLYKPDDPVSRAFTLRGKDEAKEAAMAAEFQRGYQKGYEDGFRGGLQFAHGKQHPDDG